MPSHRLRILQASDFHLSSAGPSGFASEVSEALRAAALDSFRAFCELGRSEAVDALLVPGDVFDRERVEETLLREVLVAIRDCGRPVLVAPGNHDYYSESGLWSERVARNRRLPWPENLHRFSEGRFVTIDLPGAPGRATATGICFRNHEAPGGGLDAAPPDDDRIHLLLLHGSLADRLPEGKEQVLPFSRDELLALGFDWAALGHYHSASVIRDAGATPRAAYGGIPQPRRFGEADGPTGALLVEIDKEEGESMVRVESRSLARHRFLEVVIDLAGIEAVSDAASRIEARLAEAEVSGTDLVRVELVGVVPAGIPSEELRGCCPEPPCLHLEVGAEGLLPDYPLEAAEEAEEEVTVEGAFRRRMLERLDEARREGDAEEEARVRRAYAYGMDALHRGRVVPRHVD